MKYKINRNQPPLTEEDLASARDFSGITGGYRAMKIPFYRNGKFLTRGSAIIVAAAIALIIIFDDKNETPAAPFISPPLAQINISIDSFIVDADSAAEITYKTGSRLHVPAGAFTDAQGHTVTGRVILHYREFHDQRDIFLSGIPMIYDSAGSKYIFQSAGMMEITATQNTMPLHADPAHPIIVDMVSNTPDDRYNTYYLDTIKKQWVNLNQPNLLTPSPMASDLTSDSTLPASQAIQDAKYTLKRASAALAVVENSKPLLMARSDPAKTKFHIVVDPHDFPEIAIYGGVHFQVRDEKHFDQASTRVEWENVHLRKLTGLDYEITFFKGKQKFTVLATPVVEDQDFADAKKTYDKKYAEYQTQLADKKADEAKAKKELQERYQADLRASRKLASQYKAQDIQQNKMAAKYQAMWKKPQNFQDIEIQELEQQQLIDKSGRYVQFDTTSFAAIIKTDLIFRTFVVSGFGVYNADHPYSWPTDSGGIAHFVSENGTKLDAACVYLVTKGLNVVYPFYTTDGECSSFRFDASRTNVLWAVTRDNKLVVADAKSFKARQSKDHRLEFRFRTIDQDFKSADEVKRYLSL